jgi:hypothetical protein
MSSTRLVAVAASGDDQPPWVARAKPRSSTSIDPSAIWERMTAATPSGTWNRRAAAPRWASTRVSPAAQGRVIVVSAAPVPRAGP